MNQGLPRDEAGPERVPPIVLVGAALLLGVAGALAWLGVRFDDVPLQLAPTEDACRRLGDGTRAELRRAGAAPLAALAVFAAASAVAWALAGRRGLPRPTARVVLVSLPASGLVGALLAREAYAEDDFVVPLVLATGLLAVLVVVAAHRALTPRAAAGSRRRMRRLDVLAASYLLVLPAVTVALSSTGESWFCM